MVKELPQLSRIAVDYDENKSLTIYIDGNNAIFANKEAVDFDALKIKTSFNLRK